MTNGLEKAMLYGFNDEMSGLLEISSAGSSEELDKNLQKAEMADAILTQMKDPANDERKPEV